MNIAMITGITGQDGSYLAELLLDDADERQWIVFGIMRRNSTFTTDRIDHIFDHPRLRMRYGDITDIAGLMHVMSEIKALNPATVYVFNLAAQSHVGVSFEVPLYTAQASGVGVLNVLEAIRTAGLTDMARFYQASTSEMYGKVAEVPQTETTPFHPRSPYGVAKLYGYWITRNYREAYGIHASNGVLYNHEGERRGETFVTRKITLGVAAVAKALALTERENGILPVLPLLTLGNLNAKRDWGDARDYVKGMLAILEQPEPDDYILATGETHSVREFVEAAFRVIDLEIEWKDEGVDEMGFVTIPDVFAGGIDYKVQVVSVDERYFRPAEVDLLLGDPSKAREKLGWIPKVTFEQLVKEMVESDCKRNSRK